MKKILTTTLLLVFLLSSCSTSRDTNYKSFYKEINKEYSATYTIDARGSAGLKPDKGNTQEGTKNDVDSINQLMGEITNDLKGMNKTLDDKKTAQALETALAAKKTSPATTESEHKVSTRTTLASIEKERREQEALAAASEVKKSANPKQAQEDLSKVFKNDDYEIVYPEDEGLLKKYNVVIAALRKKEGVERLKEAFKVSENPEHLLVVKNKAGLYYMIQGSFDHAEEAINKRQQIITDYVKRYSKATLTKRYGIPFADLRILSRKIGN